LFTVADELSLFPGEPCTFANQERPIADMKWVRVADGKNAACDFHIYTEVPKSTRVVGFVLNDLTAEFNAASVIYGEKGSPGWLPISFRDFTGREVARTYSDEYGSYEALVPSTYNVAAPMPSGAAPQMLTMVLNDPTMPDPANPGNDGRPHRIGTTVADVVTGVYAFQAIATTLFARAATGTGRWIDVNLTTQTATAMIGMRQVYVAYATTGKEGWETPEGTWTIISRVADETMTSAGLGLAADQEYYVQEHVLFTQYFTTGGHALHLNYWRPDWVFGRVPTSHGCVGLRYADAAYFWDFATIGTKVIVHR
jgi:lipoprotein-anchoring transpeptidase ErfK/SrfK